MVLTRNQKALLESVLMVVDEEIATWGFSASRRLSMYLKVGFDRVKTSLRHGKNPPFEWSEPRRLPRVIGREVRKARLYVDISAEDIIEVLDLAYEILTEGEIK